MFLYNLYFRKDAPETLFLGLRPRPSEGFRVCPSRLGRHEELICNAIRHLFALRKALRTMVRVRTACTSTKLNSYSLYNDTTNNKHNTASSWVLLPLLLILLFRLAPLLLLRRRFFRQCSCLGSS